MKEDRAAVELMLRSALPIDDIDQLMMIPRNSKGPGEVVTLVWVDIQDRPDLASLAHRHGDESGYFLATWFYVDPPRRNMIVGLRVDMRAPTTGVFHLAFKVERYLKELEDLADSGHLWIVPGPPPAHLTGTREVSAQELIAIGGRGISLELEPDLLAELRGQLTTWKQQR